MKKYNFLQNVLAGLLLISFVTSCEDYLDVNTDPNNPTTVTPGLILPAGQIYTAKYVQEDRRLSHLGNMLMYNWSEANGFSWYNDEFQYLVTTTFYQGLFDYAYENPLKQYHLLTELEDARFGNYVAIGNIMKAYHYQILVDLYGNIPYSEALARSNDATPAYEDGQAVYNDLIAKLNEAIALIKTTAEDQTAEVPNEDEDVMFQGDMTNWIRFANTLKVRILTRESDVNPGAVSAEMAVIAAEGTGFITDDVIVDPGFLQEENKQNPFWDDFGEGVDGTTTLTWRATAATQYILDLMGPTDNRRGRLFETPFLGVDQIAEPGTEYAYQAVSNIGDGLLKGPDMGSNIFTEAEHHFNLAELAVKGFGGDALASYNAGIQASFDYLGATGADGYIASPVMPLTDATTEEEMIASIMFQKRIAVMGITAEQSWFDYNRTGYPVTPIADEASTSDRPVRLMYPASELSTNAENVPSQPDPFTQKIFWAN